MIQKTVHYLEPQLQKIEDVDTGVAYWRVEMMLEGETPPDHWIVVESPDLEEALRVFGSQMLEHYS